MKVLVVEDEAGIMEFLKQGLEEEGYAVAMAANGNSGLSALVSEHPDIALLDWVMPGMSGLEVCQKARAQGIAIPIIFLTARDTIQETIEGLKAGANDYIKKPFSFEELLERIKIHLRYSGQEDSEITIGPVQLSLNAHKVFRDGQEVPLTQREFELLAYLMKNKGRVCSRKQIISDVWDIHFEYDTGVIDVFINAIRKKLDLDKDDDFIRTVRGIGYIAE
ncbi:MAG: response regulator transcription factor [Sphingobacteriales bacterium]|nr:MAG: response regulator transcription factor [Sphingobacteriales bacterium]